MKQLWLLLFGLVFTSVLIAQIGHGGQPLLKPGKDLDNIFREIYETDALPVQVQQLARRVPCRKGDALRFAHPFFVSMTPENSGVWSTQNDGTRIWRLGIRSKDAYSINLIFDRFNLVPGVSLYLFNPGQSLVLGAFTHLNNLSSGVLATAPIPGDELIVELHIPKGITKTSELMIGAINHDYLNLFPHLKGGDFGDSGSCQVDFTCSAEGIWRDVGRSVCKMIVDGTELCTGTLLNNTRNDGKPYVLTAGHCVEDANLASKVLFYFNYQVPNCEASIEGVATQTLSGSFLRAYAEALDFALIEMSAMPPASYQPYWAGWSRTSTPSSSVKAIHHPEGDVKKVAESESALIATTYYATSPGGVPFLTNSHWRVPTWASGTTEPGSSGCGLFDFDGLLLGSLSGGEAYCGNVVNDYFARLNKVWNHYSASNMQLAHWLAPDGTSPASVTGYDFYDGNVKRLTNFKKEDSATLDYLKPGKGVWSGHNSTGSRSLAERYTWIRSATLHGIYLVTAKSASFSSRTVNLKIWKGLTSPEELLMAKNGIALSKLSARQDNLVMLDSPLAVEGPFWVELELSYAAPVDSFALYQSAPLASREENTAWIKNDQNVWLAFDGSDVGDYPASFWMDVLASQVQYVDTSVTQPIGKNKMSLFPNPVSTKLHIRLGENGPAGIELFSLSGKLVKKEVVYVDQNLATIDLSDLRRGLYILKVTTGANVFVQNLLVD